MHYKSQPNAKTPRKTQKKSTNVNSLTKIVRFQQFSDLVGQSVPGDRTGIVGRRENDRHTGVVPTLCRGVVVGERDDPLDVPGIREL